MGADTEKLKGDAREACTDGSKRVLETNEPARVSPLLDLLTQRLGRRNPEGPERRRDAGHRTNEAHRAHGHQ